MANEVVIAETLRAGVTPNRLEPLVYLSRLATTTAWQKGRRGRKEPGSRKGLTAPEERPGCASGVSTNGLRKRAGYYTDPAVRVT